MSKPESAFCRSAPWRAFAGRVVLPWALRGQIPAGEVLEIGGGSGAMAAEVLRRYPTLRATVTDVDSDMVQAAKERLSGFGDRATAEQVDATALPFPDATFDTILSFIMLHHVVDWETAIGEAVRVLRPGGRLVGYDLLRNRLSERLHQAEGEGFRMMRVADLRRRFAELSVDADARPALAGLVVRFTAGKH